MSVTGATDTVTVRGALTAFGATLLVAVTVKVNTWFAVKTGTTGAVKVCSEPSGAAGVKATGAPPVWTQLKVRVPPEGSTPVALSVTGELLATVMLEPATETGGVAGLLPLATALLMTGAEPEVGGTIGTDNVVVAVGIALPSPTVNWKVRLCGPPTNGATKVAVALFGLLITTGGSLGLMICVHRNGPAAGVLAVASSVTVTPAEGGFGTELYLARAFVECIPGRQVTGGNTSIRERAELVQLLVREERTRLLEQLNLRAVEDIADHRQWPKTVVEVLDI